MAEVKPADVYVGVIELFSVFLPGALLLAGLLITRDLAFPAPFTLPSTAGWIAFGLVSYAAGAIVFHVASFIDELLYDSYRRLMWPRERDHSFRLATRLRREFFGMPQIDDPVEPEPLPRRVLKLIRFRREPKKDLNADNPMNTFAWAKSMLVLRAAAAFADVQRLEAESKFFRSLIVVLPLLGVLGYRQGQDAAPWLAVGLMLLAFLRYAERRRKSTEWAYRYVITLQLGPAPAEPKPGGE